MDIRLQEAKELGAHHVINSSGTSPLLSPSPHPSLLPPPSSFLLPPSSFLLPPSSLLPPPSSLLPPSSSPLSYNTVLGRDVTWNKGGNASFIQKGEKVRGRGERGEGRGEREREREGRRGEENKEGRERREAE